MKRDLYLVHTATRIREIFEEKSASGADLSTGLGVGNFCCVPLGDVGVEVRVQPALLHAHFLSEIGRGHVSPFSQEILYLGEASLSVCRWLLLGLQSTNSFLDGSGAEVPSLKLDWPDVLQAQSVADVVSALFRVVQSRVLDLRAAVVIVLLDFEVLEGFVNAWLKVREIAFIDRRQLIIEVLAWFVDDWLHTSTLLVCDNLGDFAILVEEARGVRLQAGSVGELLFRL